MDYSSSCSDSDFILVLVENLLRNSVAADVARDIPGIVRGDPRHAVAVEVADDVSVRPVSVFVVDMPRITDPSDSSV